MYVWILKLWNKNKIESTVIHGVYDSLDAIVMFFTSRGYDLVVASVVNEDVHFEFAGHGETAKYIAERRGLATVASCQKKD
jgi:hypothetical protein